MQPIAAAAVLFISLITACHSFALETNDLRLIPFPKSVTLTPGDFNLDRALVIQASESNPMLSALINAELQRAGLKAAVPQTLNQPGYILRLASKPDAAYTPQSFPTKAPLEDYMLQIQPDAITVSAHNPAGLFYGVQTLCQLIRANRHASQLPCLTIQDWPSIPWRAFQDDLTRGPSSTLQELQHEVNLGAFFKQNLFTYYMEYQYAFTKHPVIGPANGSLTPAELKSLVAYAQPLHLHILGNQQSFGHFTAILAHPEFTALRETDYLLCPVKEQTYSLLDDLYSEEIPLLPFPFFNVCCDETDGLGQGPSKSLVEKIGVGGVYVQHIKRLYDLVHGKYGKRMMMWGDIILRHPDHLKDIPKDVVMLTWGYDARPSFEDQIVPFAKSGYEFFVCPGVNCWSRVLPHFGAATTNIRNFIRDGAKQGAIGVLNTAWDDDGETFNAPNWHAFAWGAECAWNASVTQPQDFNRRLGAVLFGESGDHFGQAIKQLSTPGIDGLFNGEFWQVNFSPLKVANIPTEQARWEQFLKPVRSAIDHLEACRKGASVNAELLDFFLFGARRMEFYAQRHLDHLHAAMAYQDATKPGQSQAVVLIAQAQTDLRHARDTYAALGKRFAELWARENKPYALDWTLNRYRQVAQQYDTILQRLAAAHTAATTGQSLPSPKEIGLEIVAP